MISIVRFLGTTPQCSTLEAALFSICQQLSYNLDVPLESIPEEFVPLKNFFLMLLQRAEKRNVRVTLLLGMYRVSNDKVQAHVAAFKELAIHLQQKLVQL